MLYRAFFLNTSSCGVLQAAGQGNIDEDLVTTLIYPLLFLQNDDIDAEALQGLCSPHRVVKFWLETKFS